MGFLCCERAKNMGVRAENEQENYFSRVLVLFVSNKKEKCESEKISIKYFGFFCSFASIEACLERGMESFEGDIIMVLSF